MNKEDIFPAEASVAHFTETVIYSCSSLSPPIQGQPCSSEPGQLSQGNEASSFSLPALLKEAKSSKPSFRKVQGAVLEMTVVGRGSQPELWDIYCITYSLIHSIAIYLAPTV